MSLKTGKLGERIALEYLIKNGYELVYENFYTRFGEIDLILKEKGCYLFVEVKSRFSASLYNELPIDSFNYQKQKKFVDTINCYLSQNPYILDYRVDVITIYIVDNVLKLTHYKNYEIDRRLNQYLF